MADPVGEAKATEANVNVLFAGVMNSLRGAVTPETVFTVAEKAWAWAVSKTATTQLELPAIPEEMKKEPIPEESPPQRSELITEGQNRRLWAIAKGSGFTNEGVHNFLATHKIESTLEVPWRQYEGICKVLSDPGNANIWNAPEKVPEDDIPFQGR